MKRVPPTNTFGRLWHFLSSYRLGLVGVLLLLFIALTIYTLLVYVSRVTPHFATQEYLVAAADIAPGAKIAEGDITSVSYVVGYTPKNAVAAAERAGIVGKYALIPLIRGDVLTPYAFGKTPGGGAGGLSARLRSGTTLYYLARGDIHAAPAGVSLHDRVDIYAAGEATGSAALEGVEVLDLGTGSGEGEFYLGLVLTSKQVQTLTQLLAKKAFLQVVILPKESDAKAALVK